MHTVGNKYGGLVHAGVAGKQQVWRDRNRKGGAKGAALLRISLRALVLTDLFADRQCPGKAAEPIRAATGTEIEHRAPGAREQRSGADELGEDIGEIVEYRAARPEGWRVVRVAPQEWRRHILERARAHAQVVELEDLDQVECGVIQVHGDRVRADAHCDVGVKVERTAGLLDAWILSVHRLRVVNLAGVVSRTSSAWGLLR